MKKKTLSLLTFVIMFTAVAVMANVAVADSGAAQSVGASVGDTDTVAVKLAWGFTLAFISVSLGLVGADFYKAAKKKFLPVRDLEVPPRDLEVPPRDLEVLPRDLEVLPRDLEVPPQEFGYVMLSVREEKDKVVPLAGGKVVNCRGNPEEISTLGRFPINPQWTPGTVVMVFGPMAPDGTSPCYGEHVLRRRFNNEWQTITVEADSTPLQR